MNAVTPNLTLFFLNYFEIIGNNYILYFILKHLGKIMRLLISK
jgi:hypothetical protein